MKTNPALKPFSGNQIPTVKNVNRSTLKNSAISFQSVFDDISAKALTSAQTTQTNQKDSMSGIRMLSQALQQILNNGKEMQNVLIKIQNGQSLGKDDFLSIQAKMLNFNQDITVISKMIEQTVGSVKTILQTQV